MDRLTDSFLFPFWDLYGSFTNVYLFANDFLWEISAILCLWRYQTCIIVLVVWLRCCSCYLLSFHDLFPVGRFVFVLDRMWSCTRIWCPVCQVLALAMLPSAINDFMDRKPEMCLLELWKDLAIVSQEKVVVFRTGYGHSGQWQTKLRLVRRDEIEWKKE